MCKTPVKLTNIFVYQSLTLFNKDNHMHLVISVLLKW